MAMSQWAFSTCPARQKKFDEHVVLFDSFLSDVVCEFNLSSNSSSNESNSVFEPSPATVLLPSTDSDVQESECLFKGSCGRKLDMHMNEEVNVCSSGMSGLNNDDFSNCFTNEPFVCDDTRDFKIVNPDDLSQSLTGVYEMGNLVGDFHTTRATYRADFSFDDGASEWTDSLICDLQPENVDAVTVSYLDSDPCESTESSEPAMATKSSPYRNEDILPDGTCVLVQAALCARSYSEQVSTSWTEDTGNEAWSSHCQLLSTTSPEFISTKSLQRSEVREVKDEGQRCQMLHELRNPQNLCSEQLNREYIVSFDSWGRPNLGRNEYDGEKSSSSGNEEGVFGNVRSESTQAPARGMQLIQLMLECGQIIDSDHEKAANVLANLRSLSTRYGDPIQRLAAYFTEALSMRLAGARKSPVRTSCCLWGNECSPQALTLAYKALNEACPYFSFAQLTANQAIVEAIETAEKVHIIDFGFGIAQGVQWVALLQAIANKERCQRPARIRITGVGWAEAAESRAESLAAALERLEKFGKLMDLTVEFRVVAAAATEEEVVTGLAVEEGEVVAVNLMLGLCNLGGGGREDAAVMKMVRVAKRVAPAVLAVAEMEPPLGSGAGGGFGERFLNTLQFYAALFDSLDACMPRDCPHRRKMERWLLGESIHTLVAEPQDRNLCDWRTTAFEAAGFRPCPRSPYAVSQARALMWRFCETFTLVHDEQDTFSLSLGWQNHPLLKVSAFALPR